MSELWRTVFGDPCRECGFAWSISQVDATSLVANIPNRIGELLDESGGVSLRHPDLSWSAGAYVCHVADNLRIWAERLAGLALGATGPVAPYSEDDLARTRNYELIPPVAALWSLGRAVADWQEAVNVATEKQVIVEHPEQGPQTVLDVVRSNAHDVHHHAWDIQRMIDYKQS